MNIWYIKGWISQGMNILKNEYFKGRIFQRMNISKDEYIKEWIYQRMNISKDEHIKGWIYHRMNISMNEWINQPFNYNQTEPQFYEQLLLNSLTLSTKDTILKKWEGRTKD